MLRRKMSESWAEVWKPKQAMTSSQNNLCYLKSISNNLKKPEYRDWISSHLRSPLPVRKKRKRKKTISEKASYAIWYHSALGGHRPLPAQ